MHVLQSKLPSQTYGISDGTQLSTIWSCTFESNATGTLLQQVRLLMKIYKQKVSLYWNAISNYFIFFALTSLSLNSRNCYSMQTS